MVIPSYKGKDPLGQDTIDIQTLSSIDPKWYNKITFIDTNTGDIYLNPDIYFLKDGAAVAQYLLYQLERTDIQPAQLGLSTVDWGIIWSLSTKDMNVYDDFIFSSFDQFNVYSGRFNYLIKYNNYPINQFYQYEPGFKKYGYSPNHSFKENTNNIEYLWTFTDTQKTWNNVFFIHDSPDIDPDNDIYTYRIPQGSYDTEEKVTKQLYQVPPLPNNWSDFFTPGSNNSYSITQSVLNTYGKTMKLKQYDENGNKITWYIVYRWTGNDGSTQYEIYFKNKKNRSSTDIFGINNDSHLYETMNQETMSRGGFESLESAINIAGHESQRAAFGTYPTTIFSPGWDFVSNETGGGGLLQVSSADLCDYMTAFGIWDNDDMFTKFDNNKYNSPTSNVTVTGFSIPDENKLYYNNNNVATQFDLKYKNLGISDTCLTADSLKITGLIISSDKIIINYTGKIAPPITTLKCNVVNNCIPTNSLNSKSSPIADINKLLEYQIGDIGNPFVMCRIGLIHAARAGGWSAPPLFGKDLDDPESYVPCPRIPPNISCNSGNILPTNEGSNIQCNNTKSINNESAFKCSCLSGSGKTCNNFIPGQIDTTGGLSNCNKDCYIGPFNVSNCVSSTGWNGPLTCYMYRQTKYTEGSNYSETLPLCRLSIESGKYIRDLFDKNESNPYNTQWYKSLACQCPVKGIIATSDQAEGCGFS